MIVLYNVVFTGAVGTSLFYHIWVHFVEENETKAFK